MIREFKVKREYSGIKVGTVVESKNVTEQSIMISRGYWERLKVEPKAKKRKKKVIKKAPLNKSE